MPERLPQHDVSDVVGIGFGPSNMALAIALAEQSDGAEHGHSSHFFERQQRFGWHRGMLLDGATMQVSFLKDLASLRNPASRYSFLMYLHQMGRLSDFVNKKTVIPSRIEFHDYLEWCANQLADSVSYDSEVVSIAPIESRGVVTHVDVAVKRDNSTPGIVTRRAHNIVIGAGITPYLPAGLVASERIWHTAELRDRTALLEETKPKLVAIIGSGQSAAEAAEYLHRKLPTAEICAILSRFGYSVADDSPFTNSIFDPGAVDTFFNSGEDVKQMLIGYHSNTNYSVVDLELIEELYRRYYEEKILGESRIRMMNVSRVRDVKECAGAVQLDIEYLPTREVCRISADAVVYATGYRPTDPLPLLGGIAASCKRDNSGRIMVDRGYRVVTSDDIRCGIYMHGPVTESSHGLSAGLLSNAAVRAGEIAASINESRGKRTNA